MKVNYISIAHWFPAIVSSNVTELFPQPPVEDVALFLSVFQDNFYSSLKDFWNSRHVSRRTLNKRDGSYFVCCFHAFFCGHVIGVVYVTDVCLAAEKHNRFLPFGLVPGFWYPDVKYVFEGIAVSDAVADDNHLTVSITQRSHIFIIMLQIDNKRAINKLNFRSNWFSLCGPIHWILKSSLVFFT